jgi:hypothetical protein
MAHRFTELRAMDSRKVLQILAQIERHEVLLAKALASRGDPQCRFVVRWAEAEIDRLRSQVRGKTGVVSDQRACLQGVGVQAGSS